MYRRKIYRTLFYIVIGVLCFTCARKVMTENFEEKIKTAEDCKQVRLVIYREIEGFFKKDPEQVYSCYSPEDFVGYFCAPDDKSEWIVWDAGPEAVRTYADNAKGFKGDPENHRAYVKCVNVKGNHAIAVAHQFYTRTDTETRERFRWWFESAFMLKKIRGKWKITGFVGGIGPGSEVTKLAPPLPE